MQKYAENWWFYVVEVQKIWPKIAFFGTRNLLNPLLGFKVMSAILFEAIRIIFKGGKYYARDKKPKDTISFEGSF